MISNREMCDIIKYALSKEFEIGNNIEITIYTDHGLNRYNGLEIKMEDRSKFQIVVNRC